MYKFYVCLIALFWTPTFLHTQTPNLPVSAFSEAIAALPDSTAAPLEGTGQEQSPEVVEACSACSEAGNDLPNGALLTCDDMEVYASGAPLPESSLWRRWSTASPRATVVSWQGTKAARFAANGTSKPDMLYLLRDSTTGRFRISWRMYIPSGKKGYFNVLREVPNTSGNGANFGFEVYFDGTSKGRLSIPNGTNSATVIPFGYPEDRWFNVVVIINFDRKKYPDDITRTANLFVNNNFVYFWQYKPNTTALNKLAAIDFFADTDHEFYVDNFCHWGRRTICIIPATLATVCIKNGEQCSNAEEARCRLYTSREWWECSIACDLGGPYVYRGETYNGNLDVSDFVYIKDPVSCTESADVPEVMDVYLFYKDDNLPIQFIFNNNGNNNVFPFIFACQVAEEGTPCIRKKGECFFIDGDGTISSADLPCNNLYYITIIGPAGAPYSFNIMPNGPCGGNSDQIAINPANGTAATSGVVSANSGFNRGSNAYRSCYNGTRNYSGGEKIYRFTLDRPSQVTVSLSSASRMGVFLYSFMCGRDCINFAENTPPRNGTLTARLNDGTYYLIVDKDTGPSNNFTLTLQADDFSPFTPFTLNQGPSPICPVTPSAYHEVQLRAGAINPPLTVRDQIHFLFRDSLTGMFKGHDSLVFNWNGSTAMNFRIKKDYLQDLVKCSYVPGDTFVMFVVQSEAGKRVLKKMYPKYTGTNGNKFTVNGQSVINDMSLVNTTAFSTQKLEAGTGPSGGKDTLVLSAGLAWRVEKNPPDADWISVFPTQSDGPEQVILTLPPYSEEKPRSAVLRFYAVDNPNVYQQYVVVTQKGVCNTTPTLTLTANPTQTCGPSSVRLDAKVAAGLDDLYNYSWNGPGVAGTTAPFVNVSPANTTTYTVSISNKYCEATATRSVEVRVNGFPTAPTNPQSRVICKNEPIPSLSVGVPTGHVAEWFDSANGTQIRGTGSTYQPMLSNPVAGTYTYFVQSKNTTTGCISQTRTQVSLTIKPVPNPADAPPVCAPDLKTYSVDINNGGANLTPNLGVLGGSGNFSVVSGVPKGQNLLVTANLNGCVSTLTVTAPTCDCPTVTPPMSQGNREVCEKQPLPALEVKVGTGETVDWYNAAGTQVLMGNERYNPTAAGTYFAETRNLTHGCRSSTRTAVVLKINPLPTFSVESKKCAPDLATYELKLRASDNITAAPWAVSNNNGVFSISGVPVGQNVAIIATTNAQCSVVAVEGSPVCACPPVNPPISEGDRTVCDGQPYPMLKATPNNGETVDWYDQSGALIRSNAPSFLPPVPGIYWAEARNTTNGCRSAAKTPVRLTILPLPTLMVGTKTCAPDLNTYAVALQTNGTPQVTSGTLTGGNGLYDIVNISKGTAVTATAVLDGCRTTTTIAPPMCDCPIVAAPTVVGNDTISICEGQTIPPFRVLVGTGEKVRWYSATGALLLDGPLEYQATAPGMYSAEAYNPVNRCTSAGRLVFALVINPLPVLNTPTTACDANLLTYTAMVSGSGNLTLPSNLGGIVVTPNPNGYTVAKIPSNNDIKLNFQNAAGCTSELTIKAPVCSCPNVAPAISGGDKAVCVGQPLPVLSVSVGVNEAADWYDQSGTLVAADSLSFKPTATGTYFVEARNRQNECRSNIQTPISVAFNPLPSIQIEEAVCAPDLSTYSVNVISNGLVSVNAGAILKSGDNFRVSNIPKSTTLMVSARLEQTGCMIQQAVSPPPCACPPLLPPISLGDWAVCGSDPIPTLAVGTLAGETANWYDENGVRVAQRQTVYTPQQPGIYFAETVQTANGCTSTGRTPIAFSRNPLPTLTVEGKTCTNDLLFYKVRLSIASGSVLSASKGIVQQLGGNLYEIQAIPKDSSVTLRLADTLTLCHVQLVENPPICNCSPVPAPLSDGGVVVCEGTAFPALSVRLGSNETANWYDQSGVLALSNAAIFTPTSAGTWYVEAENKTSKCKSAVKTPVSLAVRPKPGLVVLDTVCAINRESYTLLVSAPEGVPESTPVYPRSNQGNNGYGFSGIPLGAGVEIRVKSPSSGCEARLEATKLVCPCPFVAAPVSHGDIAVCQGDAIPLLSVSVGADETISWYDTAVGRMPLATGNTYLPNKPGVYYAQKQYNPAQCISLSRTAVRLTIFDSAKVNLDPMPAVCPGQPITLNGKIANGLGGYWSTDVSGGTFEPNNNFFAAQTYTPPLGHDRVILTLTSNDPLGSCPAVSRQITVPILPNPSLTIDTFFCDPELNTYRVRLTSSDSITVDTNFKIKSSSGQYEVSNVPKGRALLLRIISKEGCVRTYNYPSPLCSCPAFPPPMSLGDKQVCEGEALPTLSVAAVPGQSIYWYNTPSGGNPIQLLDSPTYTPLAPGTYFAESVNQNNKCSSVSRSAVTLSILQKPVADAGPDVLVCPGDSATLVAASQGVTYRWDNGSAERSIKVFTLQPRTYFLTVTSPAGCTNTDQVQVGLRSAVSLSIDTLKSIRCFGQTTGALTLKPQGGTAPFETLWSTGAQDITLSNLPAGQYRATITDLAGCRATAVYDLGQPPAIAYDPPQVQHTNGPGPGIGSIGINAYGGTPPLRYQWSLDNFLLQGETLSKIDSLDTGAYQVTITDRNGCSVPSPVIRIVNTPAEEPVWASAVRISPNPTGSMLRVENLPELGQAAIEVTLYASTGQKLAKHSLKPSNRSALLDLSDYPAGIYWLEVALGQERMRWKVIRL